MPASEAPPLSREEHIHRQIFQALDIGLLQINVEGYVLALNPCAAALLGAEPSTWVGCHLTDLLPPDELASALAQIDAALAGDLRPFELTLRPEPTEGHLVTHRLSMQLLHEADGRPAQFLGVLRAAPPASSDSDTAAPAPEAVTPASPVAGFDVIAGMGHALRTPLNAMLGFAQLLRVDPSQPLSPGQREKIGHIEQSGAQLLTLLSDVLDLARLEAQRLPLQVQLLPLGPMFDEVLAHLARHAPPSGVTLLPRLSSDTLCVWADRDRLRQVLLTLLTQALDGQPPGSRILLEAQALHRQVAISVSVARPDAQAAPNAWRDRPSTERGTGPHQGPQLGLQIARRLIELMQGRLEVAPAPGVGPCLRVWLPQGQTTQPLPAEPFDNASAFGDLEGLAGEQALTVLYAEDNVVNIELVRQVMRMRPQWRLAVAYCGQDAITMALRDPPDLLLLDMHLGDMSGLDVSNVLARQAYTADIPRVALSADVLPDHIREARQQGFVDYLTKPLDVGRLLRLLDRVAQRKAS